MHVARKARTPPAAAARAAAVDLSQLAPRSFRIGASDGQGSAYPTLLSASAGKSTVTITIPDRDKLEQLPVRIKVGRGSERPMTAAERKTAATALETWMKRHADDSARPADQKNKAFAFIAQALRA